MVAPYRMVQRRQIHTIRNRVQVLAHVEETANLAWGCVPASNSKAVLQVLDRLPKLVEIIRRRRNFPL